MKFKSASTFTGLFAIALLSAPVFAQDADQKVKVENSTNSVLEEAEKHTNTLATPTAVEPNSEPTITIETNDTKIGTTKTGINRGPLVVFGRDVEVKAGDTAEEVVVIFGSAKINGTVRNNVVTICGNIDVAGKVRQEVVSILGSIKAGPGTHLHEDVVAIAGDIEINGKADRDVVAILGDIKAGEGAELHEVVAIGGRVEAKDGVKIGRQPVEIDLGGMSRSLRTWLFQCVLKLRPLAPQVGFVWIIAGLFFLLYLAILFVLPKPVMACARELTNRPATTFLMGLLAKILIPIISVLLVATGIGAIVVPFIGAAIIFGVLVGKTALFEAIGAGFGRRFKVEVIQQPFFAFLVGILFITLLYMVPVIGLITLGLVSLWGLGGAVTAAFGGWRREAPVRPIAPSPTPGPGSGSGGAGEGFAAGPAEQAWTGAAPQAGSAVAPGTSLLMPEAVAHPRAGFWERMGAALLDIFLITVLTVITRRPHFELLIALIYFTGMLTWKGTTVGGIVLGLKVVRQDGQKLTWLVALVRALAAAFSVIVLFLGFLWIIWDSEKQAWHDKIAGTVVIRVPRAAPLVCL